ncbi:hypothetical protein HRR80_007654 [Exophiala dermatitidis]|uniref:Uncharacterized protein n=1 Tax=Exophiala dermatitidis TaxID=5970 RepID=A0AAN6EN57_EXODE|nr:hypothetical protein HRR91_006348 [Exophiala dermatitidis]KAJ8988238.1 hypothetical protein HRR80_007654 [Exophiala dermatitidis]
MTTLTNVTWQVRLFTSSFLYHLPRRTLPQLEELQISLLVFSSQLSLQNITIMSSITQVHPFQPLFDRCAPFFLVEQSARAVRHHELYGLQLEFDRNMPKKGKHKILLLLTFKPNTNLNPPKPTVRDDALAPGSPIINHSVIITFLKVEEGPRQQRDRISFPSFSSSLNVGLPLNMKYDLAIHTKLSCLQPSRIYIMQAIGFGTFSLGGIRTKNR